MNKGNVLFLGCGQAGNQILSEILKRNKRYAGVFINSNYTDLEGLYGVELNNSNVVIFNGLNGAGKNRNVAKEYLKEQLPIVTDLVMNYPTRTVINVICSADGGTGSGIVPGLIKVIKTLTNKTINLICALPDYNTANLLSLDNTLDFWNDIFKPQTDKRGNTFKIEDYLNDIKVIDNSKYNGNYTKINKKVAEDIDLAYSIVGKDIDGNIDIADSQRVNLNKGFSTVLQLSSEMGVKDALMKANSESVFISNIDTKCVYGAVSVNKNDFNKNEILKELNIEVESFSTYNNSFNVIVLAGLKPIPMYAIERINKKRERLVNQINHIEEEDKFISFDKGAADHNVVEEVVSEPITLSKNIDDILEDLADLL